MENLKKSLKAFLENASSIVVLGVGSELRADDAAGMMVAQNLEKVSDKINKKVKFKVLLGHTAPENFTGEIKRTQPSHLLIIDTADIGGKPGDVKMLSTDEIAGISFSTHKLPLKVMVKFLLQEIKCDIKIIGIQPKTLEFGGSVSSEVKQAVKSITDSIKNSIIHL